MNFDCLGKVYCQILFFLFFFILVCECVDLCFSFGLAQDWAGQQAGLGRAMTMHCFSTTMRSKGSRRDDWVFVWKQSAMFKLLHNPD